MTSRLFGTKSTDVSGILEVRDAERCTPLAYAACRGREDVVLSLLQLGADVKALDCNENTILMHSVTSRNDKVACLILDATSKVGEDRSELEFKLQFSVAGFHQ